MRCRSAILLVAAWGMLVINAAWAQSTLGRAQTGVPGEILANPTSAPDAFTLVGSRNFLTDYPAINQEDGTINVVVEIPSGSVAKWEVDKGDGVLRWEFKDGKPRVVKYLGYPGNYGMVPRTLLREDLGGDGDPLDVLVLGPALSRGAVVKARIVGVLGLLDEGETDDKLIAVHQASELGHILTLAELESEFPGVTEIIRIWFENYKGPGRIEATGFSTAEEALATLRVAIEGFESRVDR